MLKLLVVTNDFPPRIGGVEQYVGQLLQHLSGDVSATVLTSKHPDACSFDRSFPARIIRWGRYPLLPTPGLTRAVVEIVQGEQVDVVVFGAAIPLALIAGSVRRQTGVPVIAFTHGIEPAVALLPGGSLMLRQIARNVTVMTAVSGWAQQRIRTAVGTALRIEPLPPGIDSERFQPTVSGAAIIDRYRLGAGPIIVTVSRLVPRKGHDRLIGALPGIAREFPTVRLLIVGGGSGRRRLERMVSRDRVTDHVVFTGPVPEANLPSCFAAGDVFAMPCRSRWGGLDAEAFGAVFLQAAAVGRPSVAGDSGGASEAVLHGETGIVVDGRRSSAVEAGVLRLLRSPGESRAFGANGALRVHRDWTWSKMAAGLERLLHEASADRTVR